MNNVKKLTITAVLTALALLANTYSIPLFGSSNYLSFTFIPCFIAGIYLGWASGLTVGLAGDILGHILHPMGAYNPLIGIATGLLGVIPAIVYKFVKANDIVKLILSFVLCMIICTSGLNTVALWLMYGVGKKTFFVYLWGRLPFQLLMVAVNCIIMITLKQSRILDKLFARMLDNDNVDVVNTEDNK